MTALPFESKNKLTKQKLKTDNKNVASNLPLLEICVVHVPFGQWALNGAKKFLRATHAQAHRRR